MNYVIHDGSTKDIQANDIVLVTDGILPALTEQYMQVISVGATQPVIRMVPVDQDPQNVSMDASIITQVWRRQ